MEQRKECMCSEDKHINRTAAGIKTILETTSEQDMEKIYTYRTYELAIKLNYSLL